MQLVQVFTQTISDHLQNFNCLQRKMCACQCHFANKSCDNTWQVVAGHGAADHPKQTVTLLQGKL